MDIKQDAYRYAVKNAFEHGGKADMGALIGKLKALHKDTDVKELVPIAQQAVKKVNAMAPDELEKDFKSFEDSYELRAKPGREGLPALDWAEKGEPVVTRFAPNPNAPPHLGNARAAYLSYAYAERYNGKFLLRFEDTDPKIKIPMKNPEAEFRKDLEWFGIKIDKVFFASDRLELYYTYMKKVIEMGKAYVCTCEPEKWRALTEKKKACPCREKPSTYHEDLFGKMLAHKLKEGKAVLRLKTDLNHPDPSVRDWWIARVVDKPEHPRASGKDHVWPSFMFESAVDDYDMGVTLILRGQEHAQNSTKQAYLYDYFGWKQPHAIHFGRLSIGEMVLSKSKINEGIGNGEFEGWDDIRLGTLRSLQRRGFRPEALQKIIVDSGLTASDANISISKLASYNKELIQEKAKRTAFFCDMMKLEVPLMDKMEVETEGAKIKLGSGVHEFYIDAQDSLANMGKVVRLRNAYNVLIENTQGFVVQGRFAGTDLGKKQVIAWLHKPMDLELVNNDGSRTVGAIEDMKLKKGDYIYLDGKGFYIIDSVDGKRPVAYFTQE